MERVKATVDTVTHILLGAVTAQLGFRGRIGPGATWAAVAAAAAPDVDVVLAPIVASTGIETGEGFEHFAAHRGLTHSLILAPVLAVVVAATWWLIRRTLARRGVVFPGARAAPFWLLYACVLLAYVTHPFLDWCTAYGTELLAPLSAEKFAANVIAVVDIFFTPILIATLLACWLARRIARRRPAAAATARGAQPAGPADAGPSRTAMAIGWAGFLASMAYLGCGELLRERTVAEARALAGPATVVRAEAYPTLGSIFVWRAVIETPQEWLAWRIRPLAGPGTPPPRGERAARESSPWIDRARQLEEARDYAWFAMGWVRSAERDEEGRHVVEFHDMRYGERTESVASMWPLRVTFGGGGRIIGATRISMYPRENRQEVLSRLWQDMWAP
jgi:inner membrane protein